MNIGEYGELPNQIKHKDILNYEISQTIESWNQISQ